MEDYEGIANIIQQFAAELVKLINYIKSLFDSFKKED